MIPTVSILLSVMVLMNVWCVMDNLLTIRLWGLIIFNLACALFGAWTVWELGINK